MNCGPCNQPIKNWTNILVHLIGVRVVSALHAAVWRSELLWLVPTKAVLRLNGKTNSRRKVSFLNLATTMVFLRAVSAGALFVARSQTLLRGIISRSNPHPSSKPWEMCRQQHDGLAQKVGKVFLPIRWQMIDVLGCRKQQLWTLQSLPPVRPMMSRSKILSRAAVADASLLENIPIETMREE